MSHLVSLSIVASNENEALQLEALHLPQTLSKLELIGQLEKKRMPQILSSWSHLHNLTQLSLLFSKLDEDSISSLAVLQGLCFLELGNAYDGMKLHFSAMSFPALQKLGIWGAPQLSRVEIEEGGLKKLVKLWFLDCPELKHLPHGIEYLTSLEDLYVYDTAQELIQKLRQEANECDELHAKISYVRRISVKSTKENT
jgi:disease resistance protein RPM1